MIVVGDVIMVMYLSIVFVCMGLIMGLNIWLGTGVFGYTPWQVVGLVCFSVVAQIIIDLLLAGVIAAIPDKCFDPDKKIFQVSKKERKFYEKLGIKSLALDSIGTRLYTTYYKNVISHTFESARIYEELLNDINNQNMDIALYKPFAYLFKNLNTYLDMPLYSNQYSYYTLFDTRLQDFFSKKYPEFVTLFYLLQSLIKLRVILQKFDRKFQRSQCV